jgi:hypothetical protein
MVVVVCLVAASLTVNVPKSTQDSTVKLELTLARV